ncbi:MULTISPECIES: CDF family Co(II)/Ni(II) efflux transporter DmeF [unclassified Acinetobacter]|uniref:CDF family Co(II)/Ni(II) efflux transporter DmeF n=1 Tax=unclassified Acinetobacter TaxID=196816 RepID=UPI002934FBBD|nr:MULTISPECIES: CDF family Co(II)/Ni(II) efflux transporter DmeF [unclassified Acinetobacter]WOE33410.1 CDF family Co(II)/Ni(II) efflux transporter DmeF [Acinetobacter sp. SAAs470]WOE36860.1 CDF family Co(II)/Ni(II) efflux transporter DmeF [Acinetobacter sp. SAAs474]
MTNNILSSKHSHEFDQGNPLAQKKILLATILTGVMMIAEIMGGYIFNSMALLADGWHMSSHMVALGLAYIAYKAARHYAKDSRFCFGTWKIEILAGYSSAILLMIVAIVMSISSIDRLLNPVVIHYDEAIFIAVIGLAINLICAWLLHDDHSHHSHHNHGHHDHNHDHHDLNQKAAFLHVVADAATSVLAIIALVAGKYFGWDFLDAVLGIVGAILVAKWAWGLISQTAKILLEAEMDEPVIEEIKEVIQELDTKTDIVDLHVWQVGRGKFSCILSLETDTLSLTPIMVKKALSIHEEIVHASIEVNHRV